MKFRLLLALLVVGDVAAQAMTNPTTTTTSVRPGASAATQTEAHATTTLASDQLARQVWGLTTEELDRAKMLLKGPRANFSVPNLSPVEALGIHARSDAERRKYAEKFAMAQHEDTERVLAWAMAYQAAMQRLYPNEKVIDFSGLPAAGTPAGATDAAYVPRQVKRPGGGAP